MRRAVLIAACLTLTGCSPKAVVVGEEASGSTVTVEPGQELRVEVAENASVGWTWDLTAEPDGAVLRFVDTDYEADDPDSTGGGGTRWFRFTGAGPGTTDLTLSRDFRGEGVDRTFTLTVDVKVGG
jgi:predicted secreted protein